MILLITVVELALNSHHKIINNKTIISNKILNPQILIRLITINKSLWLFSNKAFNNGKSIHHLVIICFPMEQLKCRIFLLKAANRSMFS
jgi:hypothetical protein